jgi:hypothetical protein
MKRRILVALIVVAVLTAAVPAVWAEGPEYTYDVAKDSHKVRNKWDLSGTFIAYPGYNWGGLAEGATWTYSIHIKEAMDGQFSVGSIHFMTGDIDVVGHVKATARDYNYWSGEEGNIAAVGTADYNDTTYYFMFLYAERAVWFAISTTPYESYWTLETVWPSSLRAYQLHSLNTNDFPLDYKIIHE